MFTPQQRLIVEEAIAAYRNARERRADLERIINSFVPVAERQNVQMLLASMWRFIDETVPEFVKEEYKNRRSSIVTSQSLN